MKKLRTTWLGVKGETWEYLATSAPLGRRVVALRWLEDNPNTGNAAGDLVLRDVTGDGRRLDFVTHDEKVIPGGTDAEADTYAKQRRT